MSNGIAYTQRQRKAMNSTSSPAFSTPVYMYIDFYMTSDPRIKQ